MNDPAPTPSLKDKILAHVDREIKSVNTKKDNAHKEIHNLRLYLEALDGFRSRLEDMRTAIVLQFQTPIHEVENTPDGPA